MVEEGKGFTAETELADYLTFMKCAQASGSAIFTDDEEERARFVAQEYWSLGLSLAGSRGGSAAEEEAGRPVLAARLTELGGKRLTKFDIRSAAPAGGAQSTSSPRSWTSIF